MPGYHKLQSRTGHTSVLNSRGSSLPSKSQQNGDIHINKGDHLPRVPFPSNTKAGIVKTLIINSLPLAETSPFRSRRC
ncbi:hypothetical protein L195_g043018 [Trifolium pratense]|uniref:Uncharacterized protein n=1 Tax=Trifolium pratense TaxID=57577 RepID=A0A2K3M835_TRIPR|nr:hypothetical protein L195_g043018 [Trifolium pratense]